MSIKEIENTARELQELRRMKEELENEITSLEDVIKAEMGNREQMTAGAFKIPNTDKSHNNCCLSV